MSTVTVLGLGAMGAALAKAQRSAGNDVVVWNRTASKAPWLDALGARREGSLAKAVGASDAVIVCLLNDGSVSEVLGSVANELRGRVVVNLTSGTPDQARAQARWSAQHGAVYLDGGIMAVPLMIGTSHAMVLYSGDERAFGLLAPILESFGRAHFVGTDPGRAALLDIGLLISMYGLLGAYVQASAMVESGGMTSAELASFAVPWRCNPSGWTRSSRRAAPPAPTRISWSSSRGGCVLASRRATGETTSGV